MNLSVEQYKAPSVFIVSSGRSGTTLLTSILNASQQVVIPYESDFIARAYPFCQHKNSYTENDYQILARMFKQSAKENGWGMSEDYLLRSLSDRSPCSFSQVISVFCEAYHKKENTYNLLWGIKSPVLISSLDRIRETYPKAKIIHIVRDGRDVFLSYRKIHDTSDIKFGPKGVIQNALYWIDGLRRVERFIDRNTDNQAYELRYEDLVQQPEKTVEKLCTFLDITYHHSMHDDYNSVQTNKKVVPKQFAQSIHRKLSDRLDDKNTSKYLSNMSFIHKFVFELLASPYLVKYSYKLEFDYLNTLLFTPIRFMLYMLARIYNDWRYDRRDRNILKQALHST